MSRLLPRAESTPAAASSASAMSSDEQPPPEATVATAPDNEQMPALEAAAAAAPAAPAAAEASATATAAAAGASSETTAQPMDTSAAAAAAAAEEASRKRRSRWAPAPAAGADTAQNAATTTADGSSQPAKKSRWASKPAAPVDPVASVLAQISPEQLEAFKIQLRIDQITRAILNPQQALAEKDATGRPRSPSPEPTYDPNTGQRLNTRPARMVKQLERERQELIESLQRANPTYKPPQGYRKQKYERRLLIPVKEYPEYNFIGMISQWQRDICVCAICLIPHGF
jgi:hypothetical protein